MYFQLIFEEGVSVLIDAAAGHGMYTVSRGCPQHWMEASGQIESLHGEEPLGNNWMRCW
jgi:hypothetical protein